MPLIQTVVPPPALRGQAALTARGLLTESLPLIASAGTTTAFGPTGATSTLAGALVGLTAGDAVTSVSVFCITAGSGVSLLKLALFSKTGVLLGVTADIHTSLAVNSFVTGTLTGGPIPIATTDGYYAAGLAVASSAQPTFIRSTIQTGIGAAIGSGVGALLAVTGQSDISGNVAVAAGSNGFWFGVS